MLKRIETGTASIPEWRKYWDRKSFPKWNLLYGMAWVLDGVVKTIEHGVSILSGIVEGAATGFKTRVKNVIQAPKVKKHIRDDKPKKKETSEEAPMWVNREEKTEPETVQLQPELEAEAVQKSA